MLMYLQVLKYAIEKENLNYYKCIALTQNFSFVAAVVFFKVRATTSRNIMIVL